MESVQPILHEPAEPVHACCAALASADQAVSAAPGSAYAQLLGLGAILILGHCAGMCGPLIMSFRFGLKRNHDEGRLVRACGQLGLYQLGRLLVYASFGALAGGLAGFVGDGLAETIRAGMPAIVLTVAAAFLILAWHSWRGARGAVAREPGRILRAGLSLRERWQGRPWRYAFGLGALMAFLPCAIPLWTLGLAAVTGSALHGALLMALLVVMTTPALLPFAVGGAWLGRLRGRWGRKIQTGAFAFSAVWLSLIALSAWQVVPHAGVEIGSLKVVFW